MSTAQHLACEYQTSKDPDKFKACGKPVVAHWYRTSRHPGYMEAMIDVCKKHDKVVQKGVDKANIRTVRIAHDA